MSIHCDINTDKAIITITSPVKQKIETKGIVNIEIETIFAGYETAANQGYQVTVEFISVANGRTVQTYQLPGIIGDLVRENNNTFVYIWCGSPQQKLLLQGNANAPEVFSAANILEVKEHPSGVEPRKKYKHRLVATRGDSGANIHSTPYFDSIPTYNVGCQGCPSGHIKCEKDTYPFYCCIPCGEILGRVNAMVKHIEKVNNG